MSEVRLKIVKSSAAQSLMEETVSAYVDSSNWKSYVELLTKTFPNTRFTRYGQGRSLQG